MQKINKKPAEEIENLQAQSTNLEVRGTNDEEKLDDIEQYWRRQNLEIVGISSKPGENTNKIVQEVAKLIKINLSEDQISTSHYLPAPQRPKNDDTGSGSWKIPALPPIIARFLSCDRCNSLYANRKLLRDANLKNFLLTAPPKFFLTKISFDFGKICFGEQNKKPKTMVSNMSGPAMATFV